jgi:hypothetical protein
LQFSLQEASPETFGYTLARAFGVCVWVGGCARARVDCLKVEPQFAIHTSDTFFTNLKTCFGIIHRFTIRIATPIVIF